MEGQRCPTYVYMVFYQRHLPHWQPKSAEFFITFRLAGSLPKQAVNKLQFDRKQAQESNQHDQNQLLRKILKKYEDLLDKAATGPTWLGQYKIAETVQNALHYHDEQSYDLYSYTIMPNHVHLIFRHIDSAKEASNNYPVTDILHSIKSYTALECNRILGRKGRFWQSESYDRVIRDQNELEKTIRYVLYNPVKAGFVDQWQDWPYSYCTSKFIKSFL